MAFCEKCGSAVEGSFCPRCGAAVGATPPSGYVAPATGVATVGLTENVASALCYLAGLITGILFLVLAPYNKNPRIRFHAFQSIFLNVAWIALWFVIGILRASMPLGINVMFGLMETLLSLAFFILWLFLMWKAYQNETFELPVVGPLARQQAART